ncbi:hypothetical protein ABZ934_29960 [Streptomyces sp. NPDC046557]|uniref:hypothetical protein n=1 Tax=Streptomyces sp. NPDC046557 TaxID=3155372 RepID=UPI0033D2A589
MRGVSLASRALASRPGTEDPARLRYDDVTAVVEAFRTALNACAACIDRTFKQPPPARAA